MLSVGTGWQKTCAGWSRRELLRVGSLALPGAVLGLPAVSRADSASAEPRNAIFIWLNGGPSHFETFDPKPDAPDGIRGPYGAIPTHVAGTFFCELLPQLALRADKMTVLRSLTHKDAGHNSTAMLAGFEGGTTAFGAVATKFLPGNRNMPPFVHIGSRRGQGGVIEPSNIDRVGGGDLGSAFEPLVITQPIGRSSVELPDFKLQADVSADRFLDRQSLLSAIDRLRGQIDADRQLGEMDGHYRQAAEMLTSARIRTAFDVSREPAPLRRKYGANFFGQACLLSRRLIEAGTRYVQLRWYDAVAFDAWDVHGAELPGMSRMEQQLCPRLDQGLSALLDDLSDRGLLELTLVVVVGEFGRTPTINHFGARDHWPFCFSAVMAGGGAPAGTVIGSSDTRGAYPATRPIRPEEFAATLYRQLGLDVINDLRIRPFIKDAVPLPEFG